MVARLVRAVKAADADVRHAFGQPRAVVRGHGDARGEPAQRAGVQSSSDASPPVWAALSSATGTSSAPSIASDDPAHRADPHRRGAERAQRLLRAGDDERARALAEQERLAGRAQGCQVDARADPARQARLGQRDREPALGDVVRRAQRARPHRLAHRGVECAQLAEVGGRELAPRRRAAELGQLGARGVGRPRPGGDDGDDVALLREAEAAGARGLRQLAHQADDRGREDRAGARLVVERDVAADDRDAEGAAGVGEAGHRARELPGDVRLLRVAEVEAVREPERLGADAGEVGRALEHGLDGAAVRVAGDPPPVAVDRDRDRGSALQLQHCGVGRLRPPDGPRADEAVVLLERPAARREVGAPEQREEDPARVDRQVGHRLRRRVHRHARRDRREVVDRALVDQRGDRHVADERLAVEHPQAPRSCHLTDRRRVDEPLLADGHDLVDAIGLDHAQHPLLGLRDHDLERLHVGLAQRHLAHVEVEPDLALRRHLGAR